jgi:hypothetical protein
MKIIERDKYEGQPFFLEGDDSADLVTGKLMKDNGEQHGWYSMITLTLLHLRLANRCVQNLFVVE